MNEFARLFVSLLFLHSVAFGNVSSAIGKHRLEFGTRGSVRTELARLQRQTGLSLVLVDNRTIQILILSPRPQAKEIKLPDGGEGGEISPDGAKIAFRLSPGIGSHLAISRIDGTDRREFPNVETVTGGMCWSNDKSRLALRATILQKTDDREPELAARERQRPSLVIVDTRSGETTEVDGQGSVSSQCWSQDDKQLVYEAGGDIRLYDVKGNRSRVLVRGTHLSWSPDGNRIAFLQDDGYYATGPSSTEKQLLFKKFHPRSGLSWSPDSRFVAFVSQSKFFECGFALDVETYCLRVRRLLDNSEWKVSASNGDCVCQWVTNEELARNTAFIFDRADALAQKLNIHPEVPWVRAFVDYSFTSLTHKLQQIAKVSNLRIHIEEGFYGLAKGRFDFFFAAFDQVQGHARRAAVLEHHAGIFYFAEVLRGQQPHPVNERQFRHDHPPASATSLDRA